MIELNYAKLAILILLLVAIIVLIRGLLTIGKKDPQDPKKTVRSLSWRIGLSILALAAILLASYFGLITPRGGPV